MTKKWDDPYWPRDGWTGAPETPKEEKNPMVDIKVDKTFSFSQDNLKDLIVDYLKREHQVEVKPEDIQVSIQDSSRGGYYDQEFIPAKLKSMSVTVKANDQ